MLIVTGGVGRWFPAKTIFIASSILMSPVISSGGIRARRSDNAGYCATLATSTIRQKVIKIDAERKNCWIYAWFAWATSHRTCIVRTAYVCTVHRGATAFNIRTFTWNKLITMHANTDFMRSHAFFGRCDLGGVGRAKQARAQAPAPTLAPTAQWISVKINSSKLLKITNAFTRFGLPRLHGYRVAVLAARIVVKTINSQFRQKLNWKF